jgi:V/A-type H+-transporting ATPase subunit C
LSSEFLEKLLKQDSVESIAKQLKIPQLDQLMENKEKKSNLFEIENAIDRYYYNKIIEFTKTLPEGKTLYANFLKNEIDMQNIKTLLRLKREGVKQNDIVKYFFYGGRRLGKETLLRLAGQDMGEIIQSLEKMGYSKIMKQGLEKLKEKKTLIDMEIDLNNYLLNEASLMLHQNPLSVDIILGYMFAKEIEIRNIKTIIKGRQLGLKDDFIERSVIVGA